jgi:hypothetical protein
MRRPSAEAASIVVLLVVLAVVVYNYTPWLNFLKPYGTALVTTLHPVTGATTTGAAPAEEVLPPIAIEVVKAPLTAADLVPLTRRQDDFDARLKAQQDQGNRLAGQGNKLVGQVLDLTTRTTALESQMRGLTAGHDTLQAKQAALQTQADANSRHLSALQGTVDDHGGRLGNAEATTSRLEKENARLKKRANRALALARKQPKVVYVVPQYQTVPAYAAENAYAYRRREPPPYDQGYAQESPIDDLLNIAAFVVPFVVH